MNQRKNLTKWVAIFSFAAILLSACGAAAPTEPTQDPNAVFTQVAQTVEVSMTQTSEAMPPTPTTAPTATVAPTLPPLPTAAETQGTQPTLPVVPTNPAGPTATVQKYGDSARYNTQTPADGSSFSPGEEFRVNVCFTNDGSSTWDTTYYLEYISGYQLWSDEIYSYVGEEIEPGEKWCFYMPAFAPHNPGSYVTRWYFKNPDGEFMQEFYLAYNVQ